MNPFRDLKYKQWLVDLDFVHYERADGPTAIVLMSRTDGKIATATVNMPRPDCGPGEVYVKDYSENVGMAQWLLDNGVIEGAPTGTQQSGYVICERYRLTPAAISKAAK